MLFSLPTSTTYCPPHASPRWHLLKRQYIFTDHSSPRFGFRVQKDTSPSVRFSKLHLRHINTVATRCRLLLGSFSQKHYYYTWDSFM